MPFELLDHTADVGVRARGTTIGEAFAEAARGMVSLMVDPEAITPAERCDLRLEAGDLEALLVRWLGWLLAEKDLSGRVFGRFQVEIEVGDRVKLRASAWGEPLDAQRHDPRIEVKGVSYLGLAVRRDRGGWIAECVLDV